MKNKRLFLTSMILVLGIVMLLGSSYSLIVNGNVTENGYSFQVANFDVEFLDNTQITISSLPTNDEDGLKNSKEFTFTVNNSSNHDVNYRLDMIENSSFPMKDVIKYVYSINDSTYSEINILGDNYTINQNKVLKKGMKDVYKLKIWLSIDADETYMNKKFSASILLSATSNDYKYATNVVEILGNNNQDGIKNINGDYRYLDKESLNYAWFNCEDNYTKGKDYCEKWRIIGSFDNLFENGNKTYKMLKIMRDNPYDNVSFNNEINIGRYNNSYIETFANGSYYDKLNHQAKNLLIKARWNIGDTPGSSYSTTLMDEKNNYYYAEIGLLNVSDYLFLEKNSWLNVENVLSLNKDGESVNILGNEINKGNSMDDYAFVPVVYLKPDVSIVGGNGSFEMPYELAIKFPINYNLK